MITRLLPVLCAAALLAACGQTGKPETSKAEAEGNVPINEKADTDTTPGGIAGETEPGSTPPATPPEKEPN